MTDAARKYGHAFIFLDPPTSKEHLNQIVSQRCLVLRSKSGAEFCLHFMGRNHTVDAICVTVPAELDDKEKSRLVAKATNHALAVLRVAYDVSANAFCSDRGPIHFYRESVSENPELGLLVETTLNVHHQVNYEKIESVFKATSSHEQSAILALIAEAQHPQLPVHYRILSLVRALELRIPNEPDRVRWLDRYESDFCALKLSGRAFRNALPEIRNWCAHGQGSGRSRDPLVGPVFSEIDAVHDLLSLLRRALIEHVESDFGWRYES